jgi:integrase
MGRRPTNNPRQMPSRACGCPVCTEKFRPGTKPKSKDCIGSWQYRYTKPDGKGTSLNRDSYDEAVADGEKARVEIRAGTWIDPKRSSITLTRWWGMWRPNLGGGESHQVLMESLWRNHVQPRFGGYPLNAHSWLEIQTWVNELGPKSGLDPESARKAFNLLDMLLSAALWDRRIPFNPADGVKLPPPKKKSKDERRPPTFAQLWRIRQQLPDHYHALQILAQETGLRWGELTGLRAWCVDLDNRCIHVGEVLVRVRGKVKRKKFPKSDAGERTVPLTGLACRVLKDHLATRQPAMTHSKVEDGMHAEELVFVARYQTRKGEPHLIPLTESTFWKTWNRACERSGVQRVTEKKLPNGKVRCDFWPTFHDQRHAFASRLHDRGVPEAIAQEILGHERAGKVTWLYMHAAPDYAGQVLAAMDDWKHRGRSRLKLVS